MYSSLARRVAVGGAVLALAGCASLTPPGEIGDSPWARASGGGWEHQRFPSKTATTYRYAREQGRDTVAVDSRAAASALRRRVDVAAQDLRPLQFSWRVPALIERADMAQRQGDDAAVRVILAFDGDRSRFSPRDAMLSELSRTLTGEELPYATLMYVWCNTRAPGTVIANPRTDRVRKLVVESGAGNLGRWLDYERDVRADFERVFGEPPGRLRTVAIMTDTDNTRSEVSAWYGPVRMVGER
jgi:hypothetical protein